jgi:hypothetical protein
VSKNSKFQFRKPGIHSDIDGLDQSEIHFTITVIVSNERVYLRKQSVRYPNKTEFTLFYTLKKE